MENLVIFLAVRWRTATRFDQIWPVNHSLMDEYRFITVSLPYEKCIYNGWSPDISGHHRTTADIAKSAVCKIIYVNHPVSLRLSSVIHPLYIRYTSEDRRGAYMEEPPQEIWQRMTSDGPSTPTYAPRSYRTIHVWLPHNQRTVPGQHPSSSVTKFKLSR